MAQEGVFGINDNSILKLSVDTKDYAEDMSTCFDKISTLVEESSAYYICDIADMYRKEFLEFSKLFKVTSNNFDSYSRDLIKVKRSLEGLDKKSKFTLNEEADDLNKSDNSLATKHSDLYSQMLRMVNDEKDGGGINGEN